MENELLDLLKKKRDELKQDLRDRYGAVSEKEANALRTIDGLIFALQGNDY